MRISDWSSDVCSSDLLAVNRHYYGCIANVEVHIAGGNNLPVAPHQTGGGHGNDVQAKGTRPRFSVGIDSRVGVILTGRHRNGQQAFPHETRQIVYMPVRSEEHTSELQSLMRTSYA